MQERLILILGSTGQLGCELIHACQAYSGWKVKGLSHQDVDVTHANSMQEIFETWKPWAVFNCTAYNYVDACEKDPFPAFAVNSGAVAMMAQLCKAYDAMLIHFSSDYVFDGKKNAPYIEEDFCCPLNVYGLSKVAGEQAVRILLSRHCILRTGGLYGPYHSPRGKVNFVEAILEKARIGDPIQVRKDLICTPTSAYELSKVACQLLNQEAMGTFHATNAGHCSWYEFAVEILRLQGLDVPITPMITATASGARRPAQSVLSTVKLVSAGLPMSSWQEALSRYLKRRNKMGK